jgi:hypothetical protein
MCAKKAVTEVAACPSMHHKRYYRGPPGESKGRKRRSYLRGRVLVTICVVLGVHFFLALKSNKKKRGRVWGGRGLSSFFALCTAALR